MNKEMTQGMIIRITTVTEIYDGEVISTNTKTTKIPVDINITGGGISEDAVGEDEEEMEGNIYIDDACTTIQAAMKCPEQNDVDEAYSWIRKECIHAMKLIAHARGIKYSTPFSNVVRKCGIQGGAKGLYEGLAKFVVNGDQSIVHEFLDATTNEDEETQILEAFSRIKTY